MTRYEFGDIILIAFPFSGSDKRKKRPALIILDVGDEDVVLSPITTRKRAGMGDYKLMDWQICGLLRESWVRLAKVSCLEKNDIIRCLGQLKKRDKEMLYKLWQELYTFSQ